MLVKNTYGRRTSGATITLNVIGVIIETGTCVTYNDLREALRQYPKYKLVTEDATILYGIEHNLFRVYCVIETPIDADWETVLKEFLEYVENIKESEICKSDKEDTKPNLQEWLNTMGKNKKKMFMYF